MQKEGCVAGTGLEAYQILFPKNTEEIIKNNKIFTGSYKMIRSRINIDEQ